MDGVRSYYFELHEVAKAAKITTDVFVMRFLTNIAGGKKLYNSYKGDIKTGLDDEEVAALYKRMMEKLRKLVDGEQSPVVKEETTFVFNYDQPADSSSELMPHWAKELQNDVSAIKSRMSSNESGYDEHEEEPEMYPAQNSYRRGSFKKQPTMSNSNRKTCAVCNKPGHLARVCFNRKCFNCEGKGHDARNCPSNFNTSGQERGGKRSLR